ncbi:hypothetical protein ASG49_09795 [Marmoricola sp. Leaf446]|nr:hypothetical protein ASG49_09795 [Marmoricola sp. Leaf446]
MSCRSSRTRLLILGVTAAFAAVSACSAPRTASSGPERPTSQVSASSNAKIVSNIPRGATNVDVDRKLRLRVEAGTFEAVEVTGPEGSSIEGRLSPDKTRWAARSPLRANSRYRITSTATDTESREGTFESVFRTRELTLDEQTYPSFALADGQTVGVGMPVVIRFDIPVTDQASIERHLKVTSRPAQAGAFRWVSGQEVHWRPKAYWRPGTDVTVEADIGGVPAGSGIYGQKDRRMTFQVGDAMVSEVDMNAHQMQVFRNGKLARTIPITTGEQPKFTTRSGIKVISEKYRSKRMNSATVGIDPDSADGYDLDDVEYAMRLTTSGEFVHAAPWSVGSQGSANVSHGCTGMSTANAEWLYNNTNVGDVIEYVGTDKPMDLTNGFGDWNTSFRDYRAGSALS